MPAKGSYVCSFFAVSFEVERRGESFEPRFAASIPASAAPITAPCAAPEAAPATTDASTFFTFFRIPLDAALRRDFLAAAFSPPFAVFPPFFRDPADFFVTKFPGGSLLSRLLAARFVCLSGWH
jgi:hypothetical protein